MSYPFGDCSKRTNQSFRNRDQIEHHKIKSIIEDVSDIDLINDIPTSDPLHLLELGITKRFLTRWVDGTKSYKNKFSVAQFGRINLLLSKISGEMPTEIHRRVRDLSTLSFWKGTEFRTFLLYVGIVVLKPILPSNEYEHFKLLSCAAKFLYSDVYKYYVHEKTLVDEMLNDFVEQYIDLYG